MHDGGRRVPVCAATVWNPTQVLTDSKLATSDAQSTHLIHQSPIMRVVWVKAKMNRDTRPSIRPPLFQYTYAAWPAPRRLQVPLNLEAISSGDSISSSTGACRPRSENEQHLLLGT
jgi:hypothetical protein